MMGDGFVQSEEADLSTRSFGIEVGSTVWMPREQWEQSLAKPFLDELTSQVQTVDRMPCFLHNILKESLISPCCFIGSAWEIDQYGAQDAALADGLRRVVSGRDHASV